MARGTPEPCSQPAAEGKLHSSPPPWAARRGGAISLRHPERTGSGLIRGPGQPLGSRRIATHHAAHVHVRHMHIMYLGTRTTRLVHICVPGYTRHVACTVGWRHTGRAVQAHLFVLALTRTLSLTLNTSRSSSAKAPLRPSPDPNPIPIPNTSRSSSSGTPLHPSPSPNPVAIP